MVTKSVVLFSIKLRLADLCYIVNSHQVDVTNTYGQMLFYRGYNLRHVVLLLVHMEYYASKSFPGPLHSCVWDARHVILPLWAALRVLTCNVWSHTLERQCHSLVDATDARAL